MPSRRHRRLALTAALVLVITVAGCSGDAPEGPSTPVDVAGTCDADVVDGLTAWGDTGYSGVVVVAGPGTTCEVGVGLADRESGRPMTTSTVFAIGSVSKTFLAAAVLQLVHDGVLSLDDPAGRWVPDLRGPAADASVESLLLHTSGLVGTHGRDHVALSRAAAVAAIGALPVEEAHRGRFLYSNAGYSLLALVVEGATRTPYRELTQRVLPDGAGFWDGGPPPDGDRAVGYVDDAPVRQRGGFGGPHWALQGNGDLAMTAPQLAAWTRSLFAGDVVPEPELGRVREPAVVDDEGRGITVGWASLSDDVLGEAAFASAGGGGDTGQDVVVAWLPATQRAVVIASNADRVPTESLAERIGAALVAGDPLPRPGDPAPVDREAIAAAAGTYATPAGDRFEVTAADDGLLVVPTGRAALAALAPVRERSATEVSRHEQAVESLLAGDTAAGVEEVAVLEADLGDLRDAEVLGSTTDEGELRTHVRLRFDEEDVIGWYALDTAGGIAAVDLGGPPSVRLLPTPNGFRVDGPAADEDAVTVTFTDRTMTVVGPKGSMVAEREA